MLVVAEGTGGESEGVVAATKATACCCVVCRLRLRRRGCFIRCVVVWFVLWLAVTSSSVDVGGVVVGSVVDVVFVAVDVVRLLRLRLKRRLSLDSSILAAPPASRFLLVVTPRRPKASL